MLGAGKGREISPEEAERRHRLRGIHAHGRVMRRRILIPLILVGVLVIGGPLVLLLAAGPERFRSVSNFLSMIVGVQLALICALSMLVIVLATYLVARVYGNWATWRRRPTTPRAGPTWASNDCRSASPNR